MSEKVARLSLQRNYKEFLYFIDGEGNVCQKPKSGRGESEILLRHVVERDSDWLYFIDKDGDISRSSRGNRSDQMSALPNAEPSLQTPEEMRGALLLNTDLMQAQAANLRSCWAQRNWMQGWMERATKLLRFQQNQICGCGCKVGTVLGDHAAGIDTLLSEQYTPVGLDLLEMAVTFILPDGLLLNRHSRKAGPRFWMICGYAEEFPTPEAALAWWQVNRKIK